MQKTVGPGEKGRAIQAVRRAGNLLAVKCQLKRQRHGVLPGVSQHNVQLGVGTAGEQRPESIEQFRRRLRQRGPVAFLLRLRRPFRRASGHSFGHRAA